MSKVYPNAKVALDGLLHDGMTIAAGGFGLCGIPETLIAAEPAVRRAQVRYHGADLADAGEVSRLVADVEQVFGRWISWSIMPAPNLLLRWRSFRRTAASGSGREPFCWMGPKARFQTE